MIVSVLLIMILPLPAVLLDVFLAINLMFMTVILVLSLTVVSPLQLSVFPSLLLITTLFRLGLNISSTRLILSKGNAGEIIETFGRYVTSGNMVVGILIFIVLLIVQFVVVSKGAERVAEVAARFTLDGLPGKQMSVDADLRSGMITSEQAKVLRSELLRESRLYGAMDGAMKFVKGDAIAGLIILVINIIGGFMIGVFQRGMSLQRAAELYSVLTIGDGLVTQIPSLMTALSAGILVTRVTDKEQNTSLGQDLGGQMLSKPYVLVVSSVILFGFGFIPGFPTAIFVLLSLMLASGAIGLMLYARRLGDQRDSLIKYVVSDSIVETHFTCAEPFLLELSPDLYQKFLLDERWKTCFDQLVPQLQKTMSVQLGIQFPPLRIILDVNLPSDHYRIKIFEVSVDEGVLYPQSYQYRGPASQYCTDMSATLTHHGTPVGLLQMSMASNATEVPHEMIPPEDVLIRYVAKVLKRHAADFVGIQEVKNILNGMELLYPELVREVVPRQMSIQKLTDVVRRLIAESVSVRNFRLILEILSSAQPENRDSIDLCELVRIGLKRQLSRQYCSKSNELSCFVLDPDIESTIQNSIRKINQDHFVTLSPQEISQIVAAVQSAYETHGVSDRQVVILTQPEIRRYVRRIIEADRPEIVVLSYQEVDSQLRIDVRDTISIAVDDVIAV